MKSFAKFLSEAEIKDIRRGAEKTAKFLAKSDKSAGHLYLKGNTVQAWWLTDALGRICSGTSGIETWTFPTAAQAQKGFEDMLERFSE